MSKNEVLSFFRQKYIKSLVFPIKFSDNINGSLIARNSSDYEDFFTIEKDDVTQQINNAKEFLTAIETYLASFF